MSDHDLLRQRIFAAIALAGFSGAALPACFDKHPPVTDAAVDTAAPTDTNKPVDTGAPVDSAAPTDDGISSDLGPPPDTGTPVDNGPPVDVAAPTDQGAPPDVSPMDVTTPQADAEAPLPTSCNVTRLVGEPVGPGPLDLTGMVLLRDLTVCAVDAAREGCVGETVSALLARRQAERASDPAVRALLSQIADDEARHAELSWRVVAWAMLKGGARVRDAVSAALRERVSSVVGLPRPEGRPEGVDRALWERFGRLDTTERDAALDAIRRDVLVPCTEALLGGRDATRAASARTL